MVAPKSLQCNRFRVRSYRSEMTLAELRNQHRGMRMSNLVTDRQPCPEQEKHELLAYLRANSHVQLPVQMMETGCPLEKGKVKGIANIGQLVTCFTNLGNTYSQKLHGTQFFCVAQALEVFRNPGEDKHPNIPTDFQKILR